MSALDKTHLEGLMEAAKQDTPEPAVVAAMTPEPGSVGALQREVQRRLGCCMLRLQQYESMIKKLAVNFQIAGPSTQLHDIQQKREAAFATQTLGGLVTALSGTYLTPHPSPTNDASGPEWEPPDNKQIWFRMDARISLDPGDYDRVVSGLRDLVSLRNRLAHHFIEMFDLWSEQGCLDADAYLDESYAQIDLRCIEASGWLQSLDKGRQQMAAFMSSDTWSDLIIHGIEPDGTVNWGLSSMVEHLREAETVLAVDSWTPLAGTMERMQTLHPEYTLELYRCSSWRQVLNDCGQFEQRCVEGVGSKDSRTWFRSRTGKAAQPR